MDDALEFKTTLQCMKNIGFSDEEIEGILDIVVGILFLGNLQFE